MSSNAEKHNMTSRDAGGIKYAIAGLLILFFVLCFTYQGTVESYGAQEGYALKVYDYKAVVNKNHSYDITQKLTVSVPADMKTITFYIPKGNYSISDIKVDGGKAVASVKDNDMEVIANVPPSASGKDHTFTLKYKISAYQDNIGAYDRMYFDPLSAAWKVPIGRVNITVYLPEDFPDEDLNMFAGQFGTQDATNKASFSVSDHVVHITADKVPANFGITLKAQLPDGYWKGAINYNWGEEMAGVIFAVILIMTLLLWLIGGRDPRMKHTRKFYPPKGMLPMETSYLDNGHFKTKDMITLLIYMGIRGYLRIQEYAPKKYRLVKLKEPPVQEEKYVRNAFNTVFRDVYQGRAVEMSDLGPRLKDTFVQMQFDVSSGYTSKDMRPCTTLSKVFRLIATIMLSLGVASIPTLSNMYIDTEMKYMMPVATLILSFVSIIATCWVFDNRREYDTNEYRVKMGASLVFFGAVVVYGCVQMWSRFSAVVVPVIIIGVSFICLWLTVIMKARARGNAVANNRVDGLRRFIATAKEKEITSILRDNPYYYYQILPYAFQFSQMEKWAKKFQYMGIQPPSWYEFQLSGHAQTDKMKKKGTVAFAFSLITFARTFASEYDGMINRERLKFRQGGF